MITGIGNDIVSIKEIERSITSTRRFVKRVFCQSEQDYSENRPDKYQHYAGCFAAKEALMKAIGTGWDKGIQWKHIEIVHKHTGAPQIKLHAQIKKEIEALGVKTLHLSLSHTALFAIATVILEK